ncbi:lipopolysaccharide biosynthesis protein [Pelagerythrobacter marinus]|uniref:lipopolysaccharide biosynthesis protein n=1 Tax=Pelagerythrobacter marinus TaxID=538382 RepID=UPI0020373EB3|nr:lipopolysaccharide biosynthesis protein [Pelagerythrobacter marinus]USA38593.1 lipopolysaccharide biosynthesis protein [Pelagerythrobacter marinus]WPZ07381.1 lipopolysaccharide biosynthesis protein [Pelagerythrobacter marinus]
MKEIKHSMTGGDAAFADRVRRALAWRWGTQVLAQIITWTSTILVVRLLSPTDYGLFAMAQTVITALAFLNGQSFATSLIQADKVDERRIGQVFALLLMLNGGLAAVQFLMAPLAADYYDEPLIADMLRIQALIFLTIPFSALPQELLARRIEFRSQGLVNLVCAVVGATTALTLAWYGFGVWALVYAPIAMFTTRAIGLTLAARILVRPVFDLRGAGDLISFGGALTLCQLFWIVQSQSDIVIAGRALETHDLGLYSEALFLTLIVTGRFLPPINEVAFPAYAELHKAGRALAPYFLRNARMVLLVVAPVYVGLSLTAEPAILTLFGSKWAEMAPFVSGLALAMPFFALQIICSPTTNAIGRPRIYLTTAFCGALIFPALFLAGIRFGPLGLVYAWWIAAPMLLAVTLALTLPAIGARLRDLVAAIAPVAAACGVMAAVVIAASPLAADWYPVAQLALLGFVGAAAYALVLWFVWPHVVRDAWAMLRQRPAPGEEQPAAAEPAVAGSPNG